MSSPGTGLLSAWWKFDETTGTRYDSHGSNHLTPYNSPGYISGIKGNALDLEIDSAQYVSIGDTAALSVGGTSFTIGFWVKFETINLTSAAQGLITKSMGGASVDEFRIWQASNRLYFILQKADSSGTLSVATDAGVLSTGVWYFVIIAYDSSVPKMTIQVDDGTIYTNSSIPAMGIDGDNDFVVGRWDTPDNRHFDGAFDELFFYKKILTSTELTWLYNSGAGRTYEDLVPPLIPTGIVSTPVMGKPALILPSPPSAVYNIPYSPGTAQLSSYWRMDEESGNRYDEILEGNTLTDYNSVLYGTGRRKNGADFVSANSEYLATIVDPWWLARTPASTPFTIGLWIRAHSVATEGQLIFGKWTDGGIKEYEMMINSSKIQFYVFDGSSIISVIANTFGTLSNNRWYFVVAYFDPTTNTIGVGVNDVFDTTSCAAVDSQTNAFYFGRNTTGGPYYDGIIDEAFIYNGRLLDSSERTWFYNSGYGRSYEDITQSMPPNIEINSDPVMDKLLIRVFDFNFDIVGVIDDFFSLSWSERYNEAGDFELEVPIKYLSEDFVVPGNFLYIESSDKLMLIEDITPQEQEEESDVLLLEGRSIEIVLNRRVLESKLNVSHLAEVAIYQLMDTYVYNPSDTDRQMTIFNSDDYAITNDSLFIDILEVQTLYEAIKLICKDSNTGFKIIWYNDELIFHTYTGGDRSYNQTTLPWVIFSNEYGNVLSSSIFTSYKDQVNVVLVLTDDSVYDSVFVWKEGESEPTGFNRIETLLETSIDRTVTSPSLTDAEVLDIINTRGRTVIKEATPIDIFEGDFDVTTGSFKYGRDFFMGDIVQCNIQGIDITARVIEAVRSYSVEGEKTYIAMEFIT